MYTLVNHAHCFTKADLSNISDKLMLQFMTQ